MSQFKTFYTFLVCLVVAGVSISYSFEIDQNHSSQGDMEPIDVVFPRPIPIKQVPAELIKLGYRNHPLPDYDRQRALQVDNFPSGMEPEADCSIAGAFTADGSRALIVFRCSHNLGVLNISTFTWETMIPVGYHPTAVAVTPSGSHALVTTLDDTVAAVNLTTWSVEYTIPVGDAPAAIAVAGDNSRAIALNSGDSSASIISLSTWTVERTVSGIVSGAWTTTWNMFNRYYQEYSEAYVLPDNITAAVPAGDTVEFINMSTGSVYTITLSPGTAKDMAISPTGTLAVVAGEDEDQEVTFINIAMNPPYISGGFELVDYRYWSNSITFNGDGSLIAFTQLPDSGGYTYLTFCETVSPYNTVFAENNGRTGGIALAPDGNSLISIGYHALTVDLTGVTPALIDSQVVDSAIFVSGSPNAANAVGGTLLFSEDMAVFDYSVANHQLLDFSPSGQMPEGDCPRRLTISPDGSVALCADYISDSVDIIDPIQGMVTGVVTCGDRSFDVSVSPDGTTALSCDYEDYQVTVIDVANHSVFTQLSAPRRPGNSVFSPDGTRAYVVTVGNTSDYLAVYDVNGASSAHVTNIAIGNAGLFSNFGGWAPNPAVTSDGSYVVVPVSHSQTVVVIDTSTLSIVATIDVSPYSSGYPYYVTFNPAGTTAYVSDGSGDRIHIIELNGASSQYLQSINPGDYPFKIFHQSNRPNLYCLNYNDENVVVIDLTSYTIIATVPLPGVPHDMTCSDDVLYVPCDASGTPGDLATINVIPMNGASTVLDVSYNTNFYGISIVANTSSNIALTSCSGWDLYSWLHNVVQVYEPYDLVEGERLSTIGDQIRVVWDAVTCPSPCYNIIYGDLGNVGSYTLSGSSCDIGSAGSYDWLSVPGGDLYYILVGTNCIDTESSWGADSADQERNGTAASGQCGITIKDTSGICP